MVENKIVRKFKMARTEKPASENSSNSKNEAENSGQKRKRSFEDQRDDNRMRRRLRLKKALSEFNTYSFLGRIKSIQDLKAGAARIYI